jgi:23S rRNA pseudouridine1911/1915/1917 synthase
VTAKPSVNVHEFIVPESAAGLRLDVFLAQQDLPYSRSQLTRRISEGEVRVDGSATDRPGLRLRAGQRLHFTPPPPSPVEDPAEDIPLEVLFEDRHLIVVNKPAGLVVHPAPGHLSGTLVNALLFRCGPLPEPPPFSPGERESDEDLDDGDEDGDGGDEAAGAAAKEAAAPGLSIGGQRRPGIVHRLDQGTSGVIVCAKDEPTLVGLQAQFAVHSIARRYVALVEGVLPERGTFATRYGRHPRDRKRFTARSGRKRAVTHYTVLERLSGATLVEVQLMTGRTHQIRVHFSEAGHPLLGDPLYGRPPRAPEVRRVAAGLGSQALHARLLGFVHPVSGEPLTFTAPPPAEFLQALQALRPARAGSGLDAAAAPPGRSARLPWEIPA